MKITKTNRELTKVEQYNLTMSPKGQKMKDVIGQRIEVKAWCVYEDVNSKGENQEILALLTPEDEIFATNSKTFKADFDRMVDIFGDELNAIEVISGKSKADREFITCSYAEVA